MSANASGAGSAAHATGGSPAKDGDSAASDRSLGSAPSRREGTAASAAAKPAAAPVAAAAPEAASDPTAAAPAPKAASDPTAAAPANAGTASGPLGTVRASVLGTAPAGGSPLGTAAAGGPLGAPGPASAVEATIRLAHAQGFSRARLSLKPAELGGVEVVLRRSGEGLSAALVADTPEAARLLEAGGEDLRRRLAAHGVELGAFSVSVAADDAAPGREGAPGSPGAAPATRASSIAGEAAGTTTAQTIDLGGGVLVDVLA